MSFLNSVLSSIDGGAPAAQAPELPNFGSDERKADASPLEPPESRKRKADDDLKKSDGKLSKSTGQRDGKPNGVPSRPTSQNTSSKVAPPMKPKPPVASQISRQSTASPAQPQAPSNPPKKGSFAEMLARGQQNQQSMQVGGIRNKPIASVGGRKETLKQLKASAKNGHRPDSRPVNGGSNVTARRSGDGKRNGEKPSAPKAGPVEYQGTAKPKPQSSYQGTAKPKPTSGYQGTMRPAGKPSSGPATAPRRPENRDGGSRKARRDEYSDEYDDVKSDGSGKQYDYVSDDYSDMEAGFDDVEGEEEAAIRAAKREDAMEQARLEKHAKDKATRKKQALQALQAEREKVRRK